MIDGMNTDNSPPVKLPVPLKYASLFLGGGSLVYFFCFLILGPRVSICLTSDPASALIANIGLSLLFFIQHSLMVRRAFKKRAARYLPERFEPAVYAIVSGLTLTLVVLFWQHSDMVFLILPVWLKPVQGLMVLICLAGFLWASRSLDSLDPMGIRPRRQSRPDQPVFKIAGPYQYVRHPMYFFTLVLIWSTTVFTLDRLVFNLLWTAWICAGARWEERDLVRLFGRDYCDYQSAVPMLLPVKPRLKDR
ncbi:MAG: isoprenylcysteine carboxylmethyltransferase family protein [Desulfobacterales bacterium]|nr:isoprenylcysteine carboxylmethyltransferase family protein [Desulfobacterales bacterium]